MKREAVQVWLDEYVEAWRTYDPAAIGDLFSQDALYFYGPFDEPLRGRKAIVASWLEDPDAPNSWEAHYTPVAVEGQVAVANGRTRCYLPDGTLESEFDNIFILHFDDNGRCYHFAEWYVRRDS